ncbi:MAG: glycosyltransferase family 2 protein [Vulcanimicrobiaceae bacterium]
MLLLALGAGVSIAAALVFAARSLQVAIGSRESIARADGSGNALPMLSIVVPARNEARQIEGCIRSLLAQRYPSLEVIVVDDRSDDATPQILERLAREDPRLQVLRGEPLPQGWVGKPWALVQGSRRAQGEWILCTDADTIHAPDACASAVTYALRRRLDLLSLLTAQEMDSPAEWIVLPAILWTIALVVGPLRDVNDPAKPQSALFNGQYLLARRTAYEAFGGHALVSAEIAEDYELARRLKADGRFRLALVDAGGLVRTRMYRNLREIWNGFSKNFALGARGDRAVLVLGVVALMCIAPLPEAVLLAALVMRAWAIAWACAGAILVAILGAALGMRSFGLPATSAAALPLGMSGALAILLNSIRLHAGDGVQWRGRRYGGARPLSR